jgi:hypothetical protein
MRRTLSVFAGALLVAAVAVAPLSAQTVTKDVQWRLGTGYSVPLGATGDVVDGGWNIHTGVDWHPKRSQFGVNVNLDFNFGHALQPEVINRLNEYIQDSFPALTDDIDGGGMWSWTLTANLMWQSKGRGPVGFYVIGGGGVYTRSTSVTDQTVGTGWYCNPWYPYWCYPYTGTYENIIAERTQTDFGWNVGAGLNFRAGRGLFYIESRYNQMVATGSATKPMEWVPITFGYKF